MIVKERETKRDTKTKTKVEKQKDKIKKKDIKEVSERVNVFYLPNRMIPSECLLTNVALIGFDFFMNLSSMNFQFALYYKFDFANVAFERSEICMKGCNVDHQC